jgi:tmRNA-binding protein
MNSKEIKEIKEMNKKMYRELEDLFESDWDPGNQPYKKHFKLRSTVLTKIYQSDLNDNEIEVKFWIDTESNPDKLDFELVGGSSQNKSSKNDIVKFLREHFVGGEQPDLKVSSGNTKIVHMILPTDFKSRVNTFRSLLKYFDQKIREISKGFQDGNLSDAYEPSIDREEVTRENTSINYCIKAMIEHHETYRQKELESSNPDIKKLYQSLEQAIIDTGILKNFPNIEMKYSLGSGRIPTQPKIYFYDKRSTTKATKGKYVAILLPDLKKDKDYCVSLAFTQGIEELENKYKNKGKRDFKDLARGELSIEAKSISEDYQTIFNQQNIDLAHNNPNSVIRIANRTYTDGKSFSDTSLVGTLKTLLIALTVYCDYESESLDVNEGDGLTTGEIKRRKGQLKFKRLLLNKHGSCMITGAKTTNVLDACHIVPHAFKANYSFDNGLLLRKDIHKLYDDKLLGIDQEGVIHISSSILEDDFEYYQYKGKKILGHISPQMSENLSEVFLEFKIAQ